MADFCNFILNEIFKPKYIYLLALVASATYLGIFKLQGRFKETTLPDFISTGFQITSICGGTKLILKVLADISVDGTLLLEMDKFYTGYGGTAVVWISLVTLRKRFKKLDKPEENGA